MKIGLFIPCFVNAVYPQVGTASFKLLRSLGVDVDYPLGQTCCGQPMANGGFEKDSAPLARNMEKLFKDYDYVVGPSGSCVAFVKEHYPEILHKEAHECLSSRIYEICEFIHDVVRPTELPRAHFPHKVSIHNSCHGQRGAEYITGADSSCLMHMEGIIQRQKLPVKTIHIVEILASNL